MKPTRGIFPPCCARAANGHAATTPPRSATNFRRLMEASLPAQTPGELRLSHSGATPVVHHSKICRPMSQMGSSSTGSEASAAIRFPLCPQSNRSIRLRLCAKSARERAPHSSQQGSVLQPTSVSLRIALPPSRASGGQVANPCYELSPPSRPPRESFPATHARSRTPTVRSRQSRSKTRLCSCR
jgi:hypothetical protein